jgi:hypothetical protein
MNVQQQNARPGRAPQASGTYFGIPLGDLGLITSILMACTLGFLSFFLVTFLSIVGIMVYNGMGHQLDYAAGYKYVALPFGCVVLLASLIFFGTLWLRRKFSGG